MEVSFAEVPVRRAHPEETLDVLRAALPAMIRGDLDVVVPSLPPSHTLLANPIAPFPIRLGGEPLRIPEAEMQGLGKSRRCR